MRMTWAALSFVLLGSLGHGSGIPVIDSSNLTQTQISALENVAQTLKQLEEYATQLKQFEEQIRNGMGLQDIIGQFNGLFSDFRNISNNISVGGNSMLGQFSGYGGGAGGAVDGSNYFTSGLGEGGSGGSNYFAASGSGGSNLNSYSAIYGSPKEFYAMEQGALRAYQTAGAEAQIATTDEWMQSLVRQQEYLNQQINEGMADIQRMIEEAADDEEGGTNKLLGVTNLLLAKLIEQNMVIQQMMITREVAEVTQFKNANARQQDMEAQARRIREDAESFQNQRTGTRALTWE
jgi:conjugal transfer/entry exclusion protein